MNEPNTSAVAPSAAAENPLATLADYDRYASEALRATAEPPQPDPAAPTEATPGTESSLGEVQSPAAPAASQPPGLDEDPEPTPEELSSLNDAGKRALQAERDKRKAAREENKTLRDRLNALEAKLNPTAPDAPRAPEATPPPPSTPSVPASLAECRTFDQVAAKELEAKQNKHLVTELILAMATGDHEAVLQTLKEQHVEQIGDTPLEEATDAQLRQLIVNAEKGCDLVIHNAPARREQLSREALAFADAGKILPGLGSPNHAAHKAFEAFVRANPNVRTLGHNWPVMVAKGIAHELGIARPTAAPNGGTPQTPTPRSAPGAPRTSTGMLPKTSDIDEVRARLHSGQGTQADMERYAVLSLRQ